MPEPLAEIVVPASTSNLGPGFDTLSVAVDLFLRVEVLGVLPTQPAVLETAFNGAPPPGENRIESAFRCAREALGDVPVGLRVRVSTDIPMAAGLGSSAAATVAGLRLYEVASGVSLEDADLLMLACQLEGHPDNAAAALLGGITVSCQCDGGRIVARSWEWPAEVRFVVAIPAVALHTTEARAVLPDQVSLAAAVANLQRALLLVRALETRQFEDIREALKDRWHQPARAPLVPGLPEALALDHPSILGAFLSGAGPSVVALAAPGRSQEAAATLGAMYQALGVPHTIRNLAAHGSAMARLPVSVTQREKTA